MNTLVLDPTLNPDQDSLRHEHKRIDTPSAFRLTIDDHGIAWLTFDAPGSSANVFNDTTLRELDDHLDSIELDPSIHALVIRSAKPKVFIAGADLKSLRSGDVAAMDALIALGQSVIHRVSRLPVPKIALIHGACVGGGFELALACDARIASDDEATRIGLPETQLGLIPGWGGCTRLPRLIGMAKALDLILSGRLVNAAHAQRLGLVDRVVPKEHLDAMVRVMLKHGMPRRARMHVSNAWPLSTIIAMQARKALHAKTRGLYEAPRLALNVVAHGVHRSMDASLQLEREALTHLVRTPETACLIDLFFKKETASKKPLARGHALPVTDVAVIGAGVMGAGIAQWLATRGVRVVLADISADAVGKGIARAQALFEEGVKRRAMSKQEARDSMDRIHPAHTRVPLHRCQMIIEAATENMELKKRIFADLATRCEPDTILATNTSALSIGELAKSVPHPERVIGLHFFNPVHRMNLVEVITLPSTSNDAAATAHHFAQAIGKTPIMVRDSPGFVVNRILVPYLMEAVRLFDTGYSVREIDGAMLAFGMPMGPLRLLDEIGMDVAAHVARTLRVEPAFLDAMIAKGWLGKKSGQGFYLHGKRERLNPELLTLRSAQAPDVHPDELQAHLAQMLSDEAKRCLEEGIASSASDIDLAMVLGTGYAPFRGGPLAHANVAKS